MPTLEGLKNRVARATWTARVAMADRRDASTRDPRIPSRALNFNQHVSLDAQDYSEGFTKESVNSELPFFQRVGLRQNSMVLDYGCGLGRTAFALSDFLNKNGAYYGVDIAPEAIEFLKTAYSSYPHFQFEHLNLSLVHYEHNRRSGDKVVNVAGVAPDQIKLSLDDEAIDFQISTSVFTHLLKDDIIATLRELARVTRSSGTCYNTWFLIDEAAETSLRAGKGDRSMPTLCGDVYHTLLDNPLMFTGYAPAAMREMYAAAGHEITQVLRGHWSGAFPENGVIYQDVVLSRPFKTPEL